MTATYSFLKLFIKFRQYQAYLQAIHTKFSRLANTQLSTNCSTDTITNQDIKVILHSVKIEYKFLHLPHNSPSSFNTHKWPDSRGHYSIAFKVPFRAANSISLHECLSENSDREKFPNTKFTHGKIHTRVKTDAVFILLLLKFQFMQLMASVYISVCQNSWYQNPSYNKTYTRGITDAANILLLPRFHFMQVKTSLYQTLP